MAALSIYLVTLLVGFSASFISYVLAYNTEGGINMMVIKEVIGLSVTVLCLLLLVVVPSSLWCFLASKSEGRLKMTKEEIMAALSVSLGTLMMSFSVTYLAGLASNKESIMTFTKDEQYVMEAIMVIFTVLGGALGLLLNWIVGCRITIISTSLLFIIPWLILTINTDIVMVIVSIGMAGLCVAILPISLPIYMEKTMEPKTRKFLDLWLMSMGNFGIMVCFVAGFFMDRSHLIKVGMTLSILFFVMLFMSETVRLHTEKHKGANEDRPHKTGIFGPRPPDNEPEGIYRISGSNSPGARP
ncbi:facilitated trehalose transporter Tret1-like [Ischnura elegans]|uniref:facilitated trehalose transporter Tret1-like n=1 Tax=Ischnura elegans TaxID=197161 RepID=UPI001ED8B394|nr:facilitated trehalose transporter Tret1-like [Ischnura elegans]